MENYESIEHVLENMEEKIVYKTKDSLLPGILLLIAAVITFVLMSINEWSTDSIYPYLFFVSGFVFAFIGVMKVFIRKSCFVSSVNHQKLKTFELYFDANERDKMIRLYTNGKIDEIRFLKRSINQGLRIRVLATKDMHLCYSQIIGYIPFEHVNLTYPMKHVMSELNI